jgi:hypothetical protein
MQRMALSTRGQMRGSKVTYALLLACYLLVLPFLHTEPAHAFAGGAGTQLSPYQISTPAELASMSSYLGSANANVYFELANDIDLNVSPYNTGSGWTPIGSSSSSTAFYGKFDGNGHTISNLYINRASTHIGLFGYVYTGAVIQDVNVTNANITNTGQRTGVLAGTTYTSTITNVAASGTVSTTGNYTGGLAGYASYSTITNSNASVAVTSTLAYAGGFAGYIEGSTTSDSTTTDSYATGNVRGSSNVGGFVGMRYYGTISRSYATGDVLGDGIGGTTNTNSGGFVGTHCQGLITTSFATGDVYGDSDIGGFAGLSHNCYGTINNSYSRGNVHPSVAGTGGSFMRYIYLGTVANSFATGSVDGQTNAGFIYYDHTCTSCINNFWDTETSGQTTGGIFSGGRGTSKTTAQMKSVATFTTTGTTGLTTPWDFVGNPNNDAANNDYWDIDPAINDGYPYLAWYTPPNNTPAVATLGPTAKVDGSWGNNGSVSLSFILSDSDGDLVQYRLQIDNDADFSSPTVDETSAQETAGTKNFTVGTALGNGTYYWRVKAIDSNGAESPYVEASSGTAAFGVDTTAPLSPDNPVRVTDANDNTPDLEIVGSTDAGGSGLASPAYLIKWSQTSDFSSGVYSDTTNATTYTVSAPLADGQWYTRATAYDVAGNSTVSDNGTFVIDTIAPVLQAISPATNATNISINPELTMQFDQIVSTVTGNILIRKASDHSVVETIPVNSGLVISNGTNTITINPDSTFEYATTYYIEVVSTAIDDLSRNYFSGISDDVTWRFTTLARPTVDNEPAAVSISTASNASSNSSSSETSSETNSSSAGSEAEDASEGASGVILLNNFADYSSGKAQQLQLASGQVVYFMHGNDEHSVTVNSIDEQTVTATIASTPKTFVLSVGDVISHDVDGDGNDDIRVALISTADGFASLTFQKITSTVASSSEKVSQTGSEAADAPNQLLWYVGIVLIGLLVMLGFIIRWKRGTLLR